MVQWLGLSASGAKGMSSIPAGGTKIPQARWPVHQRALHLEKSWTWSNALSSPCQHS